jgi:sulfoxide reductase catalytic subunit YedY
MLQYLVQPTPERAYLNRRQLLGGLGVAIAGFALSACDRAPAPGTPVSPSATADDRPPSAGSATDDLGNPLTAFESVTGYNNYYEYSFGKEGIGRLSQGLRTDPWTLYVGGLVDRPLTLGVSDLQAFPQEERVYRWRCVEAWAMVVPWVGFSLSRVLDAAGPRPEARYVRLESLADPSQMPGVKGGGYPWPYVEGLRLDEAMHPLTTLATGLYGKPLAPQNGAPVRLVVPWKYGFKGLKAIVRIELVAEQPVGFWQRIAPDEYGFYANVNPAVPHPRWSQATERVIGQVGRRKTLLYNGYGDQVAGLYTGLDLTREY